jgi:hypothetical protein
MLRWMNFIQSFSKCYLFFIYLIELQMDLTRWQWYCNETQHTKIYVSQNIAHHAQTKHSTRSYTNNKGHITHNKYNTKNKTIPVTGHGVLWGCEMLRIPHCLNSLLTVGAVRLTAIHAGRALPSEILRYLFLLQAEWTPEPWCAWKCLVLY